MMLQKLKGILEILMSNCEGTHFMEEEINIHIIPRLSHEEIEFQLTSDENEQ